MTSAAPIEPPEIPARSDDDPLVQMNVRVPKSLRDAIDARRATKGLSRDKWVTRALTWALQQHLRADPHQNTRGRTAPPPRLR